MSLQSPLGVFCLFVVVIFGPNLSRGGDEAVWTTSNLRGTPEAPKPFAVERVYPHLEFKQPVELMRLGETGRMILLEVGGKIYTFDEANDCDRADLAVDLALSSDQFMRAFGLGVPPDFEKTRVIYVVYARNPIARPDGTRLSRFRVTDSKPPQIDSNSEEVLLTWASGGHNGSAIRFDNQGYLYFSAGDGARPFPPDEYNVSQDLSDLRAKICRIDVSRSEGGRLYAIPGDNPFVKIEGARPEIWAFGFRNPWRFSIDPKTQVLLCGDVGWELWELIYRVERGGNYGWSLYEGPQRIRSDVQPGPSPIIPPLYAYPHTDGLSITGGFIYRGKEFGSLEGTYLYGDFVNGKIWGLRFEEDKVVWQGELASSGLPIITFSQDRLGEILVMSYSGTIHRLIKNADVDRSAVFPRKLSETGLYTDLKTLKASPGVMPYRLLAMADEGNLGKSYVVGIPDAKAIELKQHKRQWVFPKDSVFAKTLSLAPSSNASLERRVETQVLHFDGKEWNPYSYLWNEEQTDAVLVGPDGLQTNIPLPINTSSDVAIDGGFPLATGGGWRVLSRGECLNCHSTPSGVIAGWDFANLLGPSQTAPHRNQLDELLHRGIVKGNIKAEWTKQRMVDPADERATIEDRARSYLSINCAHCHCRGGGGTVPLELAFSHRLEQLNAIDQLPTQGAFGIEKARVIAPGDPYASVLYYRMVTVGAGHMPKLWKRDNAVLGLRVVHDWILDLESDNAKREERKKNSALRVSWYPRRDAALSTNDGLLGFSSVLFRTAGADGIEGEKESIEKWRRMATSQLTAQSDPIVRGIADRLIPPIERVPRLGAHFDRRAILAMKGDAFRGGVRYRESQSLQCRNCHRVSGTGQTVGPDLDGIGKKRTPEELLESLVDPSRKIESTYQTHLIRTAEGSTILGLMLESSDDSLSLLAADGKLHRILLDEIEERRILGASLMPSGLVEEMTAEELADLLAFLESLQ